MTWTVTGACPKCGSPIWAEGDAEGAVPPQSYHSCECATLVGRPGQTTLPPPPKDPKVERCELMGSHAVYPRNWPLPVVPPGSTHVPYDSPKCIRCGITVVLESGKHDDTHPPKGVTILTMPPLTAGATR